MEEEVGKEGIDLSDNSSDKMEPVSGKGFKGGEGVVADMGERECGGETEIVSDSYSGGFISFIKFRERFSESIKAEGIESVDFGRRRELFGKEISDMPIVDACRLSSDNDRGEEGSCI